MSAASVHAGRAVAGVGAGISAIGADVQRTVLPNGLTVLSDNVPGVRSVAFGAWVRAATLHERTEKMGISHMLEHMVFKGTETRSAKDISLALETLGGSLDAYTAREHTSYQARVLDEHVRNAADVIGDFMFHPVLREADLRLERKVVLEEIAMVDDTPDDVVFEVHNERLWGDNGYGYRILGTRDTVSSFTTDDLRALHVAAYRPDNIVVAAAGSIDHDELVNILGETGWLESAAAVDAATGADFAAPDAAPNAPSYTHVERPGAQTQLVFGSSAPAHGDPQRYAFCLVSMLLGGGMSSRLFQHVREELGLAYAVHTFSSFYSRTGMHGVYVGTSPESADEAAGAVLAELARIAEDSVPADELAAAKQQLKGQITLSLETPGARMYRAAGLELYGEPFRSLDEMLSLVDAIDEQIVSEVCSVCFEPSGQTVVSLGPAPLTIL